MLPKKTKMSSLRPLIKMHAVEEGPVLTLKKKMQKAKRTLSKFFHRGNETKNFKIKSDHRSQNIHHPHFEAVLAQIIDKYKMTHGNQNYDLIMK